jgi:hypothetical protein
MPQQHRLYPLLMKSGIMRDGTSFQGEYCTHGQWMRFQRGKPRKMGGYIADPQNYTSYTVNNIFIFDDKNNKIVMTSLSSKENNATRFYLNGGLVKNGFPDDMDSVGTFLFDLLPSPFSLIVNYVRDLTDIQSDIENVLWMMPLSSKQGIPLETPKGCNGGMRYVAPYLFVWGMNGQVAWSSPGDIRVFSPKNNEEQLTGAGSITISNDKVIQGYPIRAGAQSPAVLFWTLNSLVRVLNVGVDQVTFKADVISKNVSILSRLSVVEYDGLFFWPGTDRFFVYNGTVQEVPNILNLNWFFDHVDRGRRQQVVGVRNQKYGEIWWFYPDKRDNKPYNTRALIYNKRENTWYDTKINRDAAWYDDATGTLFAAGQNLAEDGKWQLWQHEQGTVGQNYDRSLFPIPASLQTPVISWASVGPQKEDIGLDRLMILERLEPDFILSKGIPDEEDPPALKIQVRTREYAQSAETSIDIPDLVTPRTEKLTTEISGRQMSLVFSSEDDFEMGNPLLQFDVGAAQ